jgi:hypothetical protein
VADLAGDLLGHESWRQSIQKSGIHKGSGKKRAKVGSDDGHYESANLAVGYIESNEDVADHPYPLTKDPITKITFTERLNGHRAKLMSSVVVGISYRDVVTNRGHINGVADMLVSKLKRMLKVHEKPSESLVDTEHESTMADGLMDPREQPLLVEGLELDKDNGDNNPLPSGVVDSRCDDIRDSDTGEPTIEVKKSEMSGSELVSSNTPIVTRYHRLHEQDESYTIYDGTPDSEVIDNQVERVNVTDVSDRHVLGESGETEVTEYAFMMES